ncbi:hypothetical protein [Mesorhizobium sp. M1348]|uniref:hypothetical protein n=1 Tax=Mesorhizobium sp. M1348 TaxID=2957089 RepID=UPI00333C2984
MANRTGEMLYKSTNTDVLGWIIERVSGLRDWLIEIVEAAGLEGCFHITCDREGVPLLSGGACLSARDLARYGLLFARKGEGVQVAVVHGGYEECTVQRPLFLLFSSHDLGGAKDDYSFHGWSS